MINPSQIRAARGLIGWNQADLAKACGLSLPGITKIERGIGSPRPDSLSVIQLAFEKNGVEFLDTPGVQMRTDPFDVQVWTGANAILKLWRDIEQRLSISKRNDLLLTGVNERWWLKNYSEDLQVFQRQLAVLNVRSRLLVCEGDTLTTTSVDSYRAVPKWVFAQTPHYVYDDKVALINIAPPVRVICIQSAATADTFRQQFELNWRQGVKLKK